jgi:ferric-dicitrate binding protein FerR (iron transport regulator)
VFRVVAGEAVLDVSGTTFELERQGAGVLVRVLEGRVQVAWPRGQRQLGKGQQGLFPPEPAHRSVRRQRE